MADTVPDHDPVRRNLLIGAAAAGGAMLAGAAAAAPTPDGRTDTEPRTFGSEAMPESGADKSAGPVRPGRGSELADKVAVVTGAARRIGRAIAVEFAANGADVVALDIAAKFSDANDAEPAMPEDQAEPVRQIRAYGRRGDGGRADTRDIAALRRVANKMERNYGKIDIVVANAAIQRWKPLLQMKNYDWRDVIENV